MTTEGFAFTGPNHKKSTPLSNINETIIRETELDILTLENEPSGIYNESGSSSKKRKRDININEYDPSVFVAWKKNITDFFSRTATAANKGFLNNSI